MFLHCGLLLMFLGCVRTTEYVYDYGLENTAADVDQRYSYWPSVHNALVRVRKRDVPQDVGKLSESGAGIASDAAHAGSTTSTTAAHGLVKENQPDQGSQPSQQTKTEKPEVLKPSKPANETVDNSSKATNETNISNGTAIPAPKQLDLHDPGVLMRAVIVFGGFLLLAVAYYIFYRKKGNKNDTSNTHNSNDSNQFRYGVLQSDDRRDNMELSRVPLTMESDDDDDEDLEIFDLEQKKKSLSYVNLQTNDEDIVFQNSTANGRGTDKDNLLLDIEDTASDTLINWSNNGNKSIL